MNRLRAGGSVSCWGGRVAVQKQKFGPLWATVDEKDVPKPLYSEDILHPCLGLVRPGSTLHPPLQCCMCLVLFLVFPFMMCRGGITSPAAFGQTKTVTYSR